MDHYISLHSLKLTVRPLKMDGWNTTFLLGFGLFSGDMLVSGREIFFFVFGAQCTAACFFFFNLLTGIPRIEDHG